MENSRKYQVIGLMSGTSLDGLDIVYCHFSSNLNSYSYVIYNCETIPYSKSWEDTLRNAFHASPQEINLLNIEYGKYLGLKVNDFMLKYSIKEVDFIASHGHTIFHKPEEGYTLQIGDGQTIKDITGVKVICDFRTQDVQLGGQGAPLVPIGDKLLFSNFTYCLNLGGFANISNDLNGKRIAYDICPVNIVLNYYSKQLGLNFDDGGKIARSGIIQPALLAQLNDLPFYQAAIPKSLGFEFVKDEILTIIDKFDLEIKDILRTFIAHIVSQISNCIASDEYSSILVTGGGVFNDFLIEEFKKSVKSNIIIPNKEIINFKEALIFGFLGMLRAENQNNCLSSVTGAIKDHSSGKIFM